MNLANESKFSAEIDDYIILTLELKDYSGSSRQLPEGYHLLPAEIERSQYREQEKKLLQHYFVAWRKAFKGTLPGFRKDSAIFVSWKNQLIAGVYLCDTSELRRPRWGQLHYAFIEPEHGGKGIYSVIFRESVARAKQWGLEGLVLDSDRLMLPEMYMRWGAVPYKTVRKGVLRKIAGKIWNAVTRNYSSLRKLQ